MPATFFNPYWPALLVIIITMIGVAVGPVPLPPHEPGDHYLKAGLPITIVSLLFGIFWLQWGYSF